MPLPMTSPTITSSDESFVPDEDIEIAVNPLGGNRQCGDSQSWQIGRRLVEQQVFAES